MTTKFTDELVRIAIIEDNIAFTDNDAPSHKSTLSALVDYFSNFAQYRSSDSVDILRLFIAAFNEDRTKALRLLFYSRTPRDGQGEKRIFQVIMQYMAIHYPEWVLLNLDNIIHFGYYKDLYALANTSIWDKVVKYWCEKIDSGDLLAAKYAPTETQNKNKDKSTQQYVGIFVSIMYKADTPNTRKLYRTLISAMRTNANIVEKLMTKNEWANIKYEYTPSVANKRYNKAFYKHDAERYAQYLTDVKAGKKKMNAGILTPVDIVQQYRKENVYNEAYEVMWSQLPNYFTDTGRTIVPVIDGSLSMMSGYENNPAPIDAAVSLGLYCMQNNTSEAYKNLYIMFSKNTKFRVLTKETLYAKILEVMSYGVAENTNLQNVFDKILEVAITKELKQSELPSDIIIISDMQFDDPLAIKGHSLTNYQTAQNKFRSVGYELPIVWFWNVKAKPSDYPVTAHIPNTFLISGYSPAIVKTILTQKLTLSPTPYELMVAITEREDLQRISWSY